MLGGVPQESVLGHHCTSALLCLVTLGSPLVFFPSQFLHLSCWSLTVCCCSCRLRDLEGIGKSLKYYRDSYHPLDDWIQQIETTQRKIQENQPENSKALALQLNQQKVPGQILVLWFCLHLVGHEPHPSLLWWKKRQLFRQPWGRTVYMRIPHPRPTCIYFYFLEVIFESTDN